MTQSGFNPPPSTEPAAAPVIKKPAGKAPQTNVRETIESIVVAFILAFIFRAFVVEAFVIPTGSMAPTLLGAHMRFYCPDCGYRFTVNYSPNRVPRAAGGSGDDDLVIPDHAEAIMTRNGPQARVYPITCPNCGYKFPKQTPSDLDNDGTSPPVHHGDRILVMKYLYLFQEPQRWDVVVFKSPDRPQEYDYTQNYIKRLVGKPNEVVMILDGDIYIAPRTGHLPQPQDFKVQTKPPEVQNALWRVVYDNDFHPHNLSRPRKWEQPWRPAQGNGWDQTADHGRTFRFDNLQGSGTLDFDPSANPETFPFKDFLGYDQSYWASADPEKIGDLYDLPLKPAQNTVADLKLSLTYQHIAGDGTLRLRLSKEQDVFTAELSAGKLRLLRATKNGPEKLVAETAAQWNRPHHVELQNVDYRVSILLDGKPILSTGADYAPDVAALRNAYRTHASHPLPTAEITADRQTCSISHVALHRDIFYINAQSQPEPWANPNHLMVLGPDEYFVCGDNSLISGDARLWDEPIDLPDEHLLVDSGRVPARFMLGKAFFVYWPAGYRPLPGLPGFIPNFGEMRFIH